MATQCLWHWVSAGQETALLNDEVNPGELVALTIELEGGSEQPTGDVLLSAEI